VSLPPKIFAKIISFGLVDSEQPTVYKAPRTKEEPQMSKYVEIPQKPATVHAIQYIGMENGVPLFNEPAPNWIIGAWAKGELSVVDGGLHCCGRSMDLGSWLVVYENPDRIGQIHEVLNEKFLEWYRPARKPRAVKAAA